MGWNAYFSDDEGWPDPHRPPVQKQHVLPLPSNYGSSRGRRWQRLAFFLKVAAPRPRVRTGLGAVVLGAAHDQRRPQAGTEAMMEHGDTGMEAEGGGTCEAACWSSHGGWSQAWFCGGGDGAWSREVEF